MKSRLQLDFMKCESKESPEHPVPLGGGNNSLTVIVRLVPAGAQKLCLMFDVLPMFSPSMVMFIN